MQAINLISAKPNLGLRLENPSVLAVGPTGSEGASDPFAAILSLRDLVDLPTTGPAATTQTQAVDIVNPPEGAADLLPLVAASGKILPLSGKETSSETAPKDEFGPAPDVVLTMPVTITLASPLVIETAVAISTPVDAKGGEAARASGIIADAATPNPLGIDRLPQPAIENLPGLIEQSENFEGPNATSRQRGQVSAQTIPSGATPGKQAAEAQLPGAAIGTSIPQVTVSLSVAPFSVSASIPANRRIPGIRSEQGQGAAAILPAASAVIASATAPAPPKPSRTALGESPIAADPATLDLAPTNNRSEPVELRPGSEEKGAEDGPGAVAETGSRRHGTTETAASTARQVQSPASSSQLFAAQTEGLQKVATPATANAPAQAIPATVVDRAEAIAHVVDRLMAAREVGLGAVASVAIDHREFGELKVSFADAGERLEVTIDAADTEKQRALAASLHSQDRPVTREPLTQASPASLHPATSVSPDRGGDGHAANNGGNQQANDRGLTGQQRRATSADASGAPAQSQDTAQERGGIYV